MEIPCGTGETECEIEGLFQLTDQSSAPPSIRGPIRSDGPRSSINDLPSEGESAAAFFILPLPASCQ